MQCGGVVGEKMRIYKTKLKSFQINNYKKEKKKKETTKTGICTERRIFYKETSGKTKAEKPLPKTPPVLTLHLGWGWIPMGLLLDHQCLPRNWSGPSPGHVTESSWERKEILHVACHTVVKVQSLQAIKVGTLQTHQHLEPEFSGACRDIESRGLFHISHTYRTLILSTALVWPALSGMPDIQ